MKDDTPLEDAKSLAEYRIENDDVLALTYKLPGKSTSSRNPNPITHACTHDLHPYHTTALTSLVPAEFCRRQLRGHQHRDAEGGG